MNDWIGLAFIGFVVLCGLFALWQLSKPYDVTVEEFEKRAHEAPSLLSAGFVGLQKILDPATAKAVETQEDFKEGRFDAEQAKGDGPEPGEGRGRGRRQEAGGRRQEQEAGGRRQEAGGRRQEQEAGGRSRRQEQEAGAGGRSRRQEQEAGGRSRRQEQEAGSSKLNKQWKVPHD